MAHREEAKYAPLRTKILWTLLFLVIFVVGRNIPLPLMHEAHGTAGTIGGLSSVTGLATGGNFDSPTLFSLGLGPYMGANIMWRFLMIGRLARGKNIPEQTVNLVRYLVMGALSLFQAISLSGNFTITPVHLGPFPPAGTARVLSVMMLMAGAAFLTWIANQNQDKGLGGVTSFIVYQIIITAMTNWHPFMQLVHEPGSGHILIPVGLACLGVILLGVFAGNSELRLKVNKVSIDNGFTGQSYLPVKLNPAGASPIMYAMTLLMVPANIIHALGIVFPGLEAGSQTFLQHWGLTSPIGWSVYLVLLFAMSIFFGLFTVSPKQIGDRMQDGGEYFDNVNPGRATKSFLRNRVVFLSGITGIGLVVLTGLPLFFLSHYPTYQYELMAPGTFMIIIANMWMLYEEIADTNIGRKYDFHLMAAQEVTA
ncbi:MAG: hypothetical protein LBH13_04715 [Cellulomonadaceae bacterium]|jgi:preprotein translocase subunit SecY|nr:hypothetical protein [Cellulomonadaceae bacterium]